MRHLLKELRRVLFPDLEYRKVLHIVPLLTMKQFDIENVMLLAKIIDNLGFTFTLRTQDLQGSARRSSLFQWGSLKRS